MKEEKKICHYLDLPIQHASDRILKRMGRRTTQAELVEIVNKLRREIPDIVLRTTLISVSSAIIWIFRSSMQVTVS